MAFSIPNGPTIRVMPRTSRGSASYVRQAATTAYRRGRLYYFFGLQTGPSIDVLRPVVDAVAGGLFPTYAGTLLKLLQADGWEIILAPDPADFVDPGPVVSGQWNNALVLDMRDDPAFGARFNQTRLKSFDTLMARVNADWGWLPSMAGGGSWGAHMACQIAANRATLGDGSPLIGFFAQVCPVVLGNVVNLSGLVWPFSTSGADLGSLIGSPTSGTWTSTFLNGVRVPGRVMFGSQDNVVYPGGCSVMVQSAIAAGAPLASRMCDATITGTTAFSSVTFSGGGANENGATITGPGVPTGTTLSGIVDTSGVGSGPWTGTLSKACTNTAPIAVTNVGANGSQVVYTTSGAHGRSIGDKITAYGFTSTGSTTPFGIAETPSPFNLIGYTVVATTTNTITVNSTASGTVTVLGVIGPAFAFPGLAPGYNNGHYTAGYPEYIDIANWVAATLDPSYPEFY